MLTAGGRINGYTTALYYKPSVLSGVTMDISIANEETFDFVFSIKCRSIEDLIETANSGEYGLILAFPSAV